MTEDPVPPAADLRLAREAMLADPRAFDGVLERFSQTIDARAYDDVPEAALPLAEHALKAHLARLGVEINE